MARTKCTCGLLEKLLRDKRYSIQQLDSGTHVLYSEDKKQYVVLRHCFWCGGTVGETLGYAEAQIDPVELAEIRLQTDGPKSLAEFVDRLGEPDAVSTEVLARSVAITDLATKIPIKTLFFTSKWKSANVLVMEYNDHTFGVAISKKREDSVNFKNNP